MGDFLPDQHLSPCSDVATSDLKEKRRKQRTGSRPKRTNLQLSLTSESLRRHEPIRLLLLRTLTRIRQCLPFAVGVLDPRRDFAQEGGEGGRGSEVVDGAGGSYANKNARPGQYRRKGEGEEEKGRTDVDVEVGDDALLKPFREVLAELGRADEAVSEEAVVR